MNEQGCDDPILEGRNPPGSSDLAGKHLLQVACIGDRGFLEGQKTRMDSGPRGLGSDSTGWECPPGGARLVKGPLGAAGRSALVISSPLHLSFKATVDPVYKYVQSGSELCTQVLHLTFGLLCG